MSDIGMLLRHEQEKGRRAMEALKIDIINGEATPESIDSLNIDDWVKDILKETQIQLQVFKDMIPVDVPIEDLFRLVEYYNVDSEYIKLTLTANHK